MSGYVDNELKRCEYCNYFLTTENTSGLLCPNCDGRQASPFDEMIIWNGGWKARWRASKRTQRQKQITKELCQLESQKKSLEAKIAELTRLGLDLAAPYDQ